MARVALVTSDHAAAARLQRALPAGHDGVAYSWPDDTGTDPSQVALDLARARCGVVCIGHGVPAPAMLAVADALDRLHPEVVVVLLADPEGGLLERALRVGVRDVVPLTAPPTQLADSLLRALETAQRRMPASTAGAAAPARPSRVITVLSPKGGSGKTMVATNLAVGLGAKAPGTVALIDLDAQFGDVAALLSLTPQATLSAVADAPDALDATVLKVLLTPRDPGLFALCAPDTPIEGDEITSKHAAASIELLSAAFSTVVVDTGAGLDENALAAIEASTDLLLVCTMDVASVRSMRKELDALDRMGMTSQSRTFVLNRCDARVGLEAPDIEAVLGLPVSVRIPSSRQVPMAMNRGLPVLETEPRGHVAKALGQLVHRYTPSLAATAAPPAAERWRRR